jgi:hypothetical protein
MLFTPYIDEYADINFTYGFCSGNKTNAFAEYQRQFPGWRVNNK